MKSNLSTGENPTDVGDELFAVFVFDICIICNNVSAGGWDGYN